jgi:hypothetical protein
VIRTFPTAQQHRAPVRRRKRHSPILKFTPRQIEAAHALYWERELSLYRLGEMLYERYGYAGPKRCADALRLAFRRDGLAIRSMPEAKKLNTRQRLADGRFVPRSESGELVSVLRGGGR